MAPARGSLERIREAVTEPAPPSSNALSTARTAATPQPQVEPEPITKKGATIAAATEAERAIALLARRMRERFAEGDFDQALQSTLQLLMLDAGDAEALGYRRSCERVLEQRHIERLGDLRAIPELAVSEEQVRWLALDHREGFLLSLVDGVTSVEEIFDIAGMSRLDVLKTLAGLKEADVIRLKIR
jgi:hypothetical protein